MPGAEWFAGARLNYAENLLAGKPERPSRAAARVRAARARLDHLGRAARAGRARGILGAARPRGRTWRPRRRLHAESSGGTRRLPRDRLDRRDLVVVLARLRRLQRRRPLRADRAQGAPPRRRLPLRRQATSTAARSSRACWAELPTVERTIVLGYLEPDADSRPVATPEAATGCSASGDPGEIEFAQVDFDHPLWVLYSSGTTGLPKAIVQGHGGHPRSSSSKSTTFTSTRARATGSSGSRRPAG